MSAVVLLRAEVRPGVPERFFDLLVAARRRLAGEERLERLLRRWVEPILREEGMYTESLFLDRSDDGYAVFWYMEAESMEGVNEGYEASDHPLTDLSARALGLLFEDAERLYERTAGGGDVDVLVHAWNSERP